MLAFMGTQSFIMMYQAGEGWQYGKRKQSAMSNEEFNKQTPLSIMDRQRTELINALPSIKDSMNAMTPLISTIVEQYGDFINEAIKATKPAIDNATAGLSIPGLPLAFGSLDSTSKTKPTDWLPVITGILDFLSAGHLLNKVSDRDTFNQPEQFGPPENRDTPTNTFKNIQDITKQIQSGTVKTPPQYIPESIRNPQTASQLRKIEIANSGLSPVAFAAVETFKKNIDIADAKLKALTHAYTLWSRSNPEQYYNKKHHITKKAAIAAAVKKLSALRIKFRSTYGINY